MAHPKHKHSSTRTKKRRTHYKATPVQLAKCSNCQSTYQYHRVCPECGYYRGKLAVETAVAAE